MLRGSKVPKGYMSILLMFLSNTHFACFLSGAVILYDVGFWYFTVSMHTWCTKIVSHSLFLLESSDPSNLVLCLHVSHWYCTIKK